MHEQDHVNQRDLWTLETVVTSETLNFENDCDLMSHCPRDIIWKICKCDGFPTARHNMRAGNSNSRLLHMSVLHSVTMPGIWCLNGTLRDIRLLTVMLYCRPWASVNRDTYKSLKIAVVRLLHIHRTAQCVLFCYNTPDGDDGYVKPSEQWNKTNVTIFIARAKCGKLHTFLYL